jgi:hypothetical protein
LAATATHSEVLNGVVSAYETLASGSNKNNSSADNDSNGGSIINNSSSSDGGGGGGGGTSAAADVGKVMASMGMGVREEVRSVGQTIPTDLQVRLEETLSTLRWPVSDATRPLPHSPSSAHQVV